VSALDRASDRAAEAAFVVPPRHRLGRACGGYPGELRYGVGLRSAGRRDALDAIDRDADGRIIVPTDYVPTAWRRRLRSREAVPGTRSCDIRGRRVLTSAIAEIIAAPAPPRASVFLSQAPFLALQAAIALWFNEIDWQNPAKLTTD